MNLSVAASALFGRGWTSRIFFGSLILLLLIVTRWTWIDCDGGTSALTEYGYFATDEGFYAGGGKQKLLFGRFINAVRAAPCTYAICPSTHVLTWFAFSVFGQTTWAHRVLPLLINTGAWLGLFWFLSRKTLAWIAFLLCAVCLLNPLMMVYGRTACNDSLMAAVLLTGYILSRQKGLLFPFLGGCVFGLGLWVKQSIWLLFLLGLSGAATTASTGSRWRRMLWCSLGFLMSVVVQYGLIRLMIHSDAVSQDVSIDHLLKISNSSYPLPNPFDWVMTFKGVSSFPRFPTGGLLGIAIPLSIVLPALLLLRRLTESPVRWDGRLLLYLTMPLYAVGIMIMPVYYAHYFIPVIAFIPVLWVEARHDLKLWVGRERWLVWALMAAAILFVQVSFHLFEVSEDQSHSINPYLANAYNLPQQIVWAHNGLYLLSAALLLTALGAWARRRRPTWPVIIGLLISGLGVANLCYSRLLLSEAYKYTAIFPGTMKDVASLLQVSSIVLFFCVWGLPGTCRRGVRWYLYLLLVFVVGTAANPRWRKGIPELLERGHLHIKAVAEVAKIVPDNAIVFGERAPQLFLSLKPRVVPCPNGDPVPMVQNINKQFPERPLFALLDAEHNYHYTHYEKNKDKIKLEVLRTLKLPSFNDGKPVDVFLVRLRVIGAQAKVGPLLR